MLTNNLTNKYEVFRAYYFDVNGIILSYNEALDLYGKMDADAKAAFEQFYKDETGYQIIPVAGGLDLGENVALNSKQAYIEVKYTIEAFAKKNGLVIDPIWGQYSYEEIISMVEEGVNIPQDIVDIAYTMAEQDPSTLVDDATAGEEEGGEALEEQDTYLDLIPKAVKKISSCEKTNENISEKIDELLPQKERDEKNFLDKIQKQFDALQELEVTYREWGTLQGKINNGEALTDTEAERYAELTGMLEDKNKDAKSTADFGIDKKHIANTLSELNILSVLGEELADETIEIGEELSEYVSEKNYASTKAEVSGAIGFVASVLAMAQGERISEQAVVVGEFTKEFTSDTTSEVNQLAGALDIKSQVISAEEIQEFKPSGSEFDPDKAPEQILATKAETAEGQEGETVKEDFIINDNNVKGLLKEAIEIDGELAGQIVTAVQGIVVSKQNIKFAKVAGKEITKLVNEFHARAEYRKARKEQLEKQNNESYKELEELTGKSKDDLKVELGDTSGTEGQETQGNEGTSSDVAQSVAGGEIPEENSEEDKAKIEMHKATIQMNNAEIVALQVEEETALDTFKSKTKKQKTTIDKEIPAENAALEANTEYLEKVLPEQKERLNFAGNSGRTLKRMGKYRIKVGLDQIAALQLRKGAKNVAKGTVSSVIGLATEVVSKTKLPEVAEKKTTQATKEEDTSIKAINEVDQQIIAISGDEAAQTAYDNKKAEEEKEAESTSEDTAEVSEDTTENTEDSKETTLDVVPTESTSEKIVEQTTEQIVENPTEAAQDIVEEVVENNTTTTTTSSNNSNAKEELTGDAAVEAQGSAAEKTESQQKSISDKGNEQAKETNKSAKDDAKESKKIDKDEKKDAKQLEKESKKLQKEIKQEEEEAIRLTEESMQAVEKQEEIYTEYEAIVAQNEMLAAEAEQNNQAQAVVQPQQNDEQQGQTASAPVQTGGGSDNTAILAENDERINVLNAEFTIHSRTVEVNRVKITAIDESIKTKVKKCEKKTKIKEKKVKETQKKEQEKQKNLQKQFAAIGIVENAFGITSAIGMTLTGVGTPMVPAGTAMIASGTAMLSNPATASAGAALITSGTIQVTTGTTLITTGTTLSTIGTYGTLACGVTKAAINIANGNLAAGLMSLGMSAVSAVTGAAGVGGAANSALSFVSQGLNIVSNTASLVNNVRAVQGKEANGFLSKVATVAGVAASVTNAASTLGSLKDTASTFGKVAKVGSVAGTAMTSTSQLMSEFGWGDEKTAQLLGAIGGAVSTMSSIGMVAANKMEQSKAKNEANNQERTENTDATSEASSASGDKDDKINFDEKTIKLMKENGMTDAEIQAVGNKQNYQQMAQEAMNKMANDGKLNEKQLATLKATYAKQGVEVRIPKVADSQGASETSTPLNSSAPQANPTQGAASTETPVNTTPAENTPEIAQLDAEAAQVEAEMANLDARQSDNQAARQENQAQEPTPEEISAAGRRARGYESDTSTETMEPTPEEISARGRAARGYEPSLESETPVTPNASETPTTAETPQTPEQIAAAGRQARGYESTTENNPTETPKADDKKFTWADGIELAGQAIGTASSVMGYFASEDTPATKKKGTVGKGNWTKRMKDIRARRIMALQRGSGYSSGRRYA